MLARNPSIKTFYVDIVQKFKYVDSNLGWVTCSKRDSSKKKKKKKDEKNLDRHGQLYRPFGFSLFSDYFFSLLNVPRVSLPTDHRLTLLLASSV